MYRVLLVDDEQIERMALAKRLKRHFGDSYEICEAVNGAEALKVFQRENSQIVIMDIAMPEMNGVEAAEQIRQLDEDCVIIFLTAYDEFAYVKRALVIRALDYLLKPCEEEELISAMEEALRLTERRSLFGYKTPAKIQGHGLVEYSGEESVFQEEACENRMEQVAAAIRDYIGQNYMREISMQDAARTMKYSDAYFCKLFKQCFDQNFTTYLARFRINEAKKLLRNKNTSIKDVSASVGYYDSNYFAKVFKRMTGMVPTEYRGKC